MTASGSLLCVTWNDSRWTNM